MYGTVIIRSAQAIAKCGGAEETQVSVLSGVDVGPIMKRAAGLLTVVMAGVYERSPNCGFRVAWAEEVKATIGER